MKKEFILASAKTYEKQNDDGSTWRCQIIDGLIIGMGVISGAFVSSDKIAIKEFEPGAEYTVYLEPTIRKGKLVLDIAKITNLED